MSIRDLGLRLLIAILTFTLGLGVASIYFVRSDQAIVKSNEIREGSKFAIQAPAPADKPIRERSFPAVRESITTVAGTLDVIETDFLVWKVVLNGKVILADSGEFPPHIDFQEQKRIFPFDEVIVLSAEGGNCCEFIRFWFIGVKYDGGFFISKPIGDGFAHQPTFSSGEGFVKVKIGGGPDSHRWSYLSGGEWVFRKGKVFRLK